MTAYVNTDSDLDSVVLASAFVEAVRKLNQAEQNRNAANPSQAPKNNVIMSASFEGNSFDINVALPIAPSLATNGQLLVSPTDYLGATYSAFDPGTGAAKSTTLMGAVLEVGQMLAAAEKTIQPESDQPTNISIEISLETGIATIAAQIPFTPTIGATGQVTLTALDYV